MLLVLLPVTLVLRTIQVTEGAETVRFIIFPLSFVNIPISVDHSTFSIGFIVSPVALVHRTVGINLQALTLSYLTALQPLSFILGSILEECVFSLFPPSERLLVSRIVIYKRSNLFPNLLHVHALEVFAVLRVVHAWCVHLVSESLYLSLSQPHAKS